MRFSLAGRRYSSMLSFSALTNTPIVIMVRGNEYFSLGPRDPLAGALVLEEGSETDRAQLREAGFRFTEGRRSPCTN